MSLFTTRRALLKSVPGALLLGSLPASAFAEQQRIFQPQPGTWRTFKITTTIDLQQTGGPSTACIPLPSVDTPWQRSLSSNWSGNSISAEIATEHHYGAKYLVAKFDGAATPVLEVTSLVQTQNRAAPWAMHPAARPSHEDVRLWLQPTDLMPLDGIVRRTARQITEGARTDLEKTKRIYDWVIVTTYREPKVRGCGTGDVKAMLENQSFGGKCGDINGLFVALCRASGIPARDAYGIRLAPSAFGYAQLGGNSASLSGAQHCRAEVYLKQYGWVAMDPADVGKVMRMETADWIKDPDHPLVSPVRKTLFGGWEGNWMAYNFAHDLQLPGKGIGKVAFLMYPQAETNGEAYDSLDPAGFKYTISAQEIQM